MHPLGLFKPQDNSQNKWVPCEISKGSLPRAFPQCFHIASTLSPIRLPLIPAHTSPIFSHPPASLASPSTPTFSSPYPPPPSTTLYNAFHHSPALFNYLPTSFTIANAVGTRQYTFLFIAPAPPT